VTVPAEVLATFTALKTRRRYKWMSLKLSTTSFTVEVDKTGEPATTARAFIAALPTDARYFIYDHEAVARSGMKKNVLLFITWMPRGASGTSKVFYTSQRRRLDTVFTGVEDVQCTTAEDVAKALGETSMIADDEEEWDPDA